MELHVCNHCSGSYEESEVLVAEHDTICRECFEAYTDLQKEIEEPNCIEDELPF